MAWTIPKSEETKMRDFCIAGFPLESCGLFVGPVNPEGAPTGEITSIWPANNIENSARIYSVDPKDLFEATKFASENSQDVIGVFHSHTHTQAKPSPTDIKQAVDPNWCYAIVSLMEDPVEINYFSIKDEESIPLECKRI